jgi:hypothetical protein
MSVLLLMTQVPMQWFGADPKAFQSPVTAQSLPHEPSGMKAVFAEPEPAQVKIHTAPSNVLLSSPKRIETLAMESKAVHQLGPEEIANLLKRGRELLDSGKISAARLIFEQAAQAGDASAALELGTTYDPTIEGVGAYIERLTGHHWSSGSPLGIGDFVYGMTIERDMTKARVWYQKARDLGSSEAQARLDRLADRER